MLRQRLDLLLVERGLAGSRSQAQALIMAGQVRVDGQVELKASAQITPAARLDLERGPRFVSRGGEKLEAALVAFPIRVERRICADVGASTGGFTDCLLQHGAAKVYAIDVGKGLLHWKLRSDTRVFVMEETNARYVKSLPEPVGLVTIDAAFISLKILLPVVKRWISPPSPDPFPLKWEGENNGKLVLSSGVAQNQFSESPSRFVPQSFGREEGGGEIIALVKPQFEAGRKESARHKGVIRDPAVHKAILMDMLSFAQGQGFGVRGLLRSPVLGPKGNVEFLAWLGMSSASVDMRVLVEQALGDS